jgi:GTP-binding protein HflX
VSRHRPDQPDPRHLCAAGAEFAKASCRSNWRSSNTWRRGWCAAGRTWNGRRAVSACAVPGETQLETDRRLLGIRVKLLKERAGQLERQRGVQRKARGRGELLNVSLVGYTNAGKSTLFNALTHAGVFAADQLFATLDTTTRKLWLPEAGHIVLSDTVGFIRDLPHSLVAAFHATLEATAEADLLLHVVDSASPARDEQVADVNKVLAEIGAADVPQLDGPQQARSYRLPPAVERDEYGRILRVRVSARCGDGLPLLREALAEMALAKTANLRERVSGAVASQDNDMVFDSDGSP